MTNNHESLIDRTQEVIDLAKDDLRKYVGDRIMDALEASTQEGQALKEDYLMHLDYVTLFTNSAEENKRLQGEASSIGAKFYDKGGSMYDLSDAEILAPAVRIGDPNPENTRKGSVDFVFGREAFRIVTQKIYAQDLDSKPKTKTARKQAEGAQSGTYTLVQTARPGSDVAITCLTTSFVDIVR